MLEHKEMPMPDQNNTTPKTVTISLRLRPEERGYLERDAAGR